PAEFTKLNNAMYFAATPASGVGREIYKLGADGSVTKWADIHPLSGGAVRYGFTEFKNALYFQAVGPTGDELYKLGADGSVTLWKDINPGPGDSLPFGADIQPSSAQFNDALWFAATSRVTASGADRELWKLGADGSVTFWADINPGP